MRFDRLVTHSRIVDLKSKDLRGAFGELIDLFGLDSQEGFSKDAILKDLIEKEKTRTTYLGEGIAMPYARIPWNKRYGIAIGRCPDGLSHDSPSAYGKVRVVVMLLVNDRARNYVRVLSDIAQILQDENIVDNLTGSDSLDEFKSAVRDALGGGSSLPQIEYSRINRNLLREAEKIAMMSQCTSLMIFGDTFTGGAFELGIDIKGIRTVLVSPGKTEYAATRPQIDTVIPIRTFSNSRLSQLRSAFIIGLGKGVFTTQDVVCCVGGLPRSNLLDTILIIDVDREFQSLIPGRPNVIPPGIQVEVLERVLSIATELSLEGREGKPVGSLFVLGDSEKVLEHSQPLLLNPFYGYSEDERNVLNPFMDETIKELSSIDGAFVIKGNGVVESAGSLLRPTQYPQNLPSGLGSRHAAAAGISLSFKCVAIVVSSSTGHVSLFSGGDMILLTENKIGGYF
ncbi:MAG: diadenylate cyclase [Opitutales bacterium]|nr:diadenylate cyclase [Opitutales bacterium]